MTDTPLTLIPGTTFKSPVPQNPTDVAPQPAELPLYGTGSASIPFPLHPVTLYTSTHPQISPGCVQLLGVSELAPYTLSTLMPHLPRLSPPESDSSPLTDTKATSKEEEITLREGGINISVSKDSSTDEAGEVMDRWINRQTDGLMIDR